MSQAVMPKARGVSVPTCNLNHGVCPVHQSPELQKLQTQYNKAMKSLSKPQPLSVYIKLENITDQIAAEHRRVAEMGHSNNNASMEHPSDQRIEIFPGSTAINVPVTTSETEQIDTIDPVSSPQSTSEEKQTIGINAPTDSSKENDNLITEDKFEGDKAPVDSFEKTASDVSQSMEASSVKRDAVGNSQLAAQSTAPDPQKLAAPVRDPLSSTVQRAPVPSLQSPAHNAEELVTAPQAMNNRLQDPLDKLKDMPKSEKSKPPQSNETWLVKKESMRKELDALKKNLKEIQSGLDELQGKFRSGELTKTDPNPSYFGSTAVKVAKYAGGVLLVTGAFALGWWLAKRYGITQSPATAVATAATATTVATAAVAETAPIVDKLTFVWKVIMTQEGVHNLKNHPNSLRPTGMAEGVLNWISSPETVEHWIYKNGTRIAKLGASALSYVFNEKSGETGIVQVVAISKAGIQSIPVAITYSVPFR